MESGIINLWDSVEQVALEVPKWLYEETLGHVEKIHGLVQEMAKTLRAGTGLSAEAEKAVPAVVENAWEAIIRGAV